MKTPDELEAAFDAKECLIELLAEISVGHVDNAAEYAEELARWISRGGNAIVVTDVLKGLAQGNDQDCSICGGDVIDGECSDHDSRSQWTND